MIKEFIYLNKNIEHMPDLHDFEIKDVYFENQSVVFIFEDDVSYHDTLKENKKNLKSLILKCHLENDFDDIRVFKWKRGIFKTRRLGIYKEVNIKFLKKEATKRLVFISQYIGYKAIILKLWSKASILIEMNVDYLEYNWIEAV